MRIEVFGTHTSAAELQELLLLAELPTQKAENVLGPETFQLIAAGIGFLAGGIVGPIVTHELTKRRNKNIETPKVVNVVIPGHFHSFNLVERQSGESQDLDFSELEQLIAVMVAEKLEELLISLEFED